MEDGDLAKYIPSFGDRLALVNFCKNQTAVQKKKMGLFEKHRSKLRMRKERVSGTDTGHVISTDSQIPVKKRGRATQRKIEIGLLHCENGQLKQIRTKKGRGHKNSSCWSRLWHGYHPRKRNRLFLPQRNLNQRP